MTRNWIHQLLRPSSRKVSLSMMFAAGVLACVASSASAQATTAPTPLDRQLAKIDFALGGIGSFNGQVSGTVPNNGAFDANTLLTEKASNTVGVFGQVRYTASPWVGIEFNASQNRYTETFNVNPQQIQTTTNEFSFGYFVTPKVNFFGLQPFAGLDAGSTRFRPTRGGGQGAPIQWRATYAYNIGLQTEFGTSHFGARVAFRQAFFKAPDFLLNYLTINQHTNSIEPNFLFYVRF